MVAKRSVNVDWQLRRTISSLFCLKIFGKCKIKLCDSLYTCFTFGSYQNVFSKTSVSAGDPKITAKLSSGDHKVKQFRQMSLESGEKRCMATKGFQGTVFHAFCA